MMSLGFAVGVEEGKVIIDLCGRRHDVKLDCGTALRFAEVLDSAAAEAEKQTPGIYLGEPWGCQVESYDCEVWMRFDPPHVGAPERVPLPPPVARRLADTVRSKESWARHGIRLVLTHR